MHHPIARLSVALKGLILEVWLRYLLADTSEIHCTQLFFQLSAFCTDIIYHHFVLLSCIVLLLPYLLVGSFIGIPSKWMLHQKIAVFLLIINFS